MTKLISLPDRRYFLTTLSLGVAAFTASAAYSDELTKTPPMTEGPFYPDKLPLDTDNDLILINDKKKASLGQISHLTGRVLDTNGNPVRGAVVEIWQCDNNGAYLHSGTSNKEKRDANFQGYGRFLTGSKGEYYFRTIKPVAYPGRTPHIHVKVKKNNKELICSQCFVKGHPGNEKDGIWKNIKDPKARDLVTVAFDPIAKSRTDELAASMDLVVGVTPELE